MVKHQFLHMARRATERAKALLAGGDDNQLRYSALELRLAMEALTYDRAQAYVKEIPPEQMKTWQPDKVMKVLLEIEPTADSSYTLSVGEEPFPGGVPEKMQVLGTDTVFALADLRKHYHAVGSALHTPTMGQLEEGKPQDMGKLRQRLEAIASDLTKSLNSPVRNFTMGNFSNMDCQRCGNPIRKRMPHGQASVEAKCFSCGAAYELSTKDGQVWWKALFEEMACRTADCGEVFTIWQDKIRDGAAWQCRSCGQGYRIGYAVFPAVQPNEGAS